MKDVAYRLVTDEVSQDVVEAALQLLEGAHSGEIIGLAFVVILKGRRFFTNLAGVALSDPHLTRGMLQSLDDELRVVIHEQREARDTGT